MLHPQDDPCLQIPCIFHDGYLELVKQHVAGVRPRLVYNIDETDYSDWEERKPFQGILPASMAGNTLHFPVTRKIKYQTMLVCINAGGEALFPLIVTSDPATKQVFRDPIEEDVDLKVQVGSSAYVDAAIFYSYIHDILIPTTDDYRYEQGIPNAVAVLLMDNCSAHLSLIRFAYLLKQTLKLLLSHCTHQMLDLVFFGIFKQTKRGIWRDPSVNCMQDHARHMFRAFETAAASSTVRACFLHAGFIYERDDDSMYTLEFDEAEARSSPEFKEVWDINFPVEGLSARRRASFWSYLNPERFSD
jgi:hypothetical protein